jgi:transcriptional regulator with XRE-family HTH domain
MSPIIVALRQERLNLKLRLVDVSDKTGYHYNAIQRWEAGKVAPSVQAVVDYANALGFDVVLKKKE